VNKLFMGLFSVLTVLAGMATTATYPVSKGDTVGNLAHTAAQRSVAQATMARSIRVGSAGYSAGGYSRGGGSYRGGK